MPRPLLAAVAMTLAVAACSSGQGAVRAGHPIAVSVSSCGQGWSAHAAGPAHLTVTNTDSRAGEVQLVDPRTGAVFVDIEPLGPGTTTATDVNLRAGRYAWRCVMEDEAAITGPTLTLTGHATGTTTPGIVPVTQADLIGATKAYETYVRGRLPGLAGDVARLRADIDHDNLAAARRDWLIGHVEYERLGAAYDAFGDLDGAINGLATGLPDGVHDSSWTGFHRIEYGLWHGESAAGLRPVAAVLAQAVAGLRQQFASAQLDPGQLAIRAHEISENALEFELTGRSDYGSHSALATVRANLEGTRTVLGIVHDLAAPRYPALGRAEAAVTAALSDIDRHASHERLDADVSELCELLAPIASVLEPRRTS